jgi:hypothetical protein
MGIALFTLCIFILMVVGKSIGILTSWYQVFLGTYTILLTLIVLILWCERKEGDKGIR